MNGYLAAAVAVLITASYPVATRAGVTGAFAPHELVTLRFGVGALLFLPYLLLHWRHVRRAAWLQGVPLTLFQGAGMAALVICGLQLAPATHAAALGPGAIPAWVTLLGFLVFAKRPSTRVIIGCALCAMGVLVLTYWSASQMNAAVLSGDAMFLAASALGALYVLQLRRWGIDAIQGAAIVSLYSALIVVPWHLWSAAEPLRRVEPFELLWQVLWQGVLIGCVWLIALNHAIARLGRGTLKRTCRAGARDERDGGARVPRRGPLGHRDRRAPRDLRRRPVSLLSCYAGSPAATSASMNRPACGLSRPG